MMILGIDSAPLNCGWCAWDTNEPKPRKWGVYNPGEYGGNNLLLARDVRKWMMRQIDEFSPAGVYIEGVALDGSTPSVRTWVNQITVMCAIDLACELNELTCYQFAPQQWRAHFLGFGRYPSEVAKRKAISRAMEIGVITDNDHIAEAIGICEFGMFCADYEYQQRTKHDLHRRQAAASRERMQGIGPPLIKGKRR